MVEYKVRPVIRYIVTKFESDEDTYALSGGLSKGSCSSSVIGEFQLEEYANGVKDALETSPLAISLPPVRPL